MAVALRRAPRKLSGLAPGLGLHFTKQVRAPFLWASIQIPQTQLQFAGCTLLADLCFVGLASGSQSYTSGI